MPIKIKEMLERDCCQQGKDLKRYKGENSTKYLWFCQHCGQLWEESTRMDAAGGTEVDWVKVPISPNYRG